ncbi:hypothetical protein Ping_1496 [Psychromonas ingrahamii 37]|uniref:Uncharacterized protein n=1 Tax=Psychromonas ingrahamii (strain DSM 17664 / CCUG 51855 / 37) TaxID=357804 RepID=A1SUZ6_PSYIN|nr:hypothetical protein [Psychromonas ingrahamii]ABM03311.1 hypothetical protein Ping_1496 [Psychromonas ingrahamii 37]
MEYLWDQAQFIAPGLIVMVTNSLGDKLGTEAVNIKTGRVEVMCKPHQVTVQNDGDCFWLASGKMPNIDISQDEADLLAKLLKVEIGMGTK